MNTIILYDTEYAHVVNNETGQIFLEEGPKRLLLAAHMTLKDLTKYNKIVLKENQWCTLTNPWSHEDQSCLRGETRIVVGPRIFSLHPGESVSQSEEAMLLNRTQYLFVQATADFDDDRNLENGDAQEPSSASSSSSAAGKAGKPVRRLAGEQYRVTGPALFIPHRLERIVPEDGKLVRNAIAISEKDAIYIRDKNTSQLSLINGPAMFMAKVSEELFYKPLSNEEYEALKIRPKPSYQAYNIEVQKNEMVCVIDYQTNTEKYVLGPRSVILGPSEGVKVLSISGGRPKQENYYRVAVVQLGVDFCVDLFPVRTRDNATLEVEVSYTWRFLLDDEGNSKIFSGDFIGYACQSLRSRIREVVSTLDFEEFHTNSSKLLRDKLFKDYSVDFVRDGKLVKESFHGRFYNEFNFLVASIDVKSVRPIDDEIRELLDQSIRASMRILTNKLEDEAQISLEREKILSEVEVSELRHNLIALELANLRAETIEAARTKGRALITKAEAEAESSAMLRKAQLDQELKNLQQQLQMLESSGDRFLQYKKITLASQNVSEATVLPQGQHTHLKLQRY